MYLHFSFDDVYHNIKDLSKHAAEYRSVFDNPFFGWMKSMHDTYGSVFSLYTFNQMSTDPDYDITCFPDCFAQELALHSHWLKFGFHAKDDQKKYDTDEPEQIREDYQKFLNAILHATGNHIDSIDRVPRLGFCKGTRENVLAIRDTEYGIQGLLGADDNRLLYYLGQEETSAFIEKGEFHADQLLFLRSQTRMEAVTSLEALQQQIASYTGPGIIEVFSHEACWYYPGSHVEGFNVRQLCEAVIQWAHGAGYQFEFAQNIY